MLELIRLLKDIRDQAEFTRDEESGSIFAVDDPVINRIEELATTYLLTDTGDLHLYNVRTLEMQTGAKVKVVERIPDEYTLGTILIRGGSILFGG